MKLRNKKTGEIGILNYYDGKIQVVLIDMPLCGNSVLGEYETIAELCEEWEDYEEPKKYYWVIDEDGVLMCRTVGDFANEEMCKQIGNHFETEEEAKKAVERLHAWRRLEDKGFKFGGYDDIDRGQLGDIVIYAEMPTFEYDDDLTRDDLDLLFGGKE